MRSILIVPTVLGMLLVSGAAFADQGDHLSGYDKCVNYDLRLGKVLPDAKGATATEAKALRSQGNQLCAKGEFDAGAAKLRMALSRVGIMVPS